ncbi:hypothetical protein N665_0272s0008 [Sinapis alba]|nr:hypothetical protein N665_0272s0008 [Sinapis alba]
MTMKNIQTCLLILLCLCHVRVTHATLFHFRDEVLIPPIWISTPHSPNCGAPIQSIDISGKKIHVDDIHHLPMPQL